MALDFTKLPPEQSTPDTPPSRVAWTIVFFVIVLGGVFSVLLLWPTEKATRTPWFWICVTVFPVGIAALVVLRRFSLYEGDRLDAIAWNEAREKYLAEQFERESRPLAILAAAYRFSSNDTEDGFAQILAGTTKLESRSVPKPDTRPMKVRWFATPSKTEKGAPFATDEKRQKAVLPWAFDALLKQLRTPLLSLPDELPITIRIVTPDLTKANEIRDDWRDAWASAGLKPREICVSDAADLMTVDTWLDQVNLERERGARLIVMVRLSTIIQSVPSDGSAEVATAVLLAPPATQEKFKLEPIAWLHRPNSTMDCSVDVGLNRALQWGSARPDDLKRIWQSGLTGDCAVASSAALAKTGIGTRPTVLDDLIGHAGYAAPWLGLVCAAKAATQNADAQLLVATDKKALCFFVVRSASRH